MSHDVPAIEKFEGEMITEEMVAAAAKLFSQNYGVWGPMAAEKIGSFAKQGELLKFFVNSYFIQCKRSSFAIYFALLTREKTFLLVTYYLLFKSNNIIFVQMLKGNSNRRKSEDVWKETTRTSFARWWRTYQCLHPLVNE